MSIQIGGANAPPLVVTKPRIRGSGRGSTARAADPRLCYNQWESIFSPICILFSLSHLCYKYCKMLNVRGAIR